MTNLYTEENCFSLNGKNLEGKILVLNPKLLKVKIPENQLWEAIDGFGCNPESTGTCVFAKCIATKEKVRWERNDFIGILK